MRELRGMGQRRGISRFDGFARYCFAHSAMSIERCDVFQTEASYNFRMIDPMSPMVLKDNRPLRVWLARGIAVAADAVQLALFPISVEGALSPVDDGLDVFVAIILTLLLGWHIAFVPSFIIKLLPFADLAPSWTIAVLIATRGGAAPSADRPLPDLVEQSGQK